MKLSKGYNIVLGILLVTNIMTLNTLGNLENNISNRLNNGINSIHNEVTSIQDQVEQIRRENAWISNFYDEVLGQGSQDYNLKVRVSWTFNHLEKNTQVYLLVKGDQKENWKRFTAQNTAGLNYAVDLDLNSADNYETQVLVVSPTGEKSKPEGTIRLKEMFQNRYDINTHTNRKGEKVSWNIDVMEFGDLKLQEEYKDLKVIKDFEIKSIKAKLYKEGKLFKTEEFKKEIYDTDFIKWTFDGETKENLTGKVIIEFKNGQTREEFFPQIGQGKEGYFPANEVEVEVVEESARLD
ncbi:hypothetical protein SAMN00017405_1757 [Desulfonispora thiosulfatigenes DSM 11270]|uniref:Uncharacterized protein n=1 Tax=Desulfonispora thiosulfatigenes DSM 11270 TaxID=656914 RepID=A0A1W1V412_DESTI|nr:hypothetical protein [Desulfonispora thiosulfatigenes]SMB87761.1 hypothetical protein SAMN00017405_1757 [Desulfonispora thiosulfatigenes DSM 11270]